MARVNIEDKIFADGRFILLRNILGSEELAIGKLVLAWRFAQTYYVKKQNIPHSVFESMGFLPICEVGLATKKDDGYYVSGTSEQFAWIEQKSVAGIKSGIVRREKAERKRTDVQFSFEQKVNGFEPPTPTPTPTPTLTQSKKEEEEEEAAAVLNLDDFEIPINTLKILQCALMYPDHVIESFRKDAILIFNAKDDPGKNWGRFVSHYFKNEKGKIEEYILATKEEKSWVEMFKERNPDYIEER